MEGVELIQTRSGLFEPFTLNCRGNLIDERVSSES
jgi:hypothetical protein